MAWNRSNEKKVEVERKGGPRNVHLKGLIAGAIVVLGAGLAAWLIWPDAKPPLSTPTSTSTSLIKEVKTAAASAPKSVSYREVRVTPKVSAKKNSQSQVVITNENGMVINRRHRSYVITNLGGDKDDSPSLFENPVHQELYHYTICGDDPPPPEDFSDEEVLQATAERIVVNPTDTDEVVARKEVVASMLQEIQDFILKENGHAKDYFKMLVQRQEMEGEMIDTVRTDVRSLMKEGRDDDARIALKKYNDYLVTRGITPIVVKGLKAMEDTNE